MEKDTRPQDEISTEVIVHPRQVVTQKSGAVIAKQIRSGKATKALRDLMLDLKT